MNENLDLTKILNGCPEGTEFYSSVYGRLFFRLIAVNPDNNNFPVRLQTLNNKEWVFLTKEGKYGLHYENSECILFPSKDQRDWSKFERFWDKPKKEMFDLNTLQPFDKVLVRADDGHTWRCSFFSHIVSDDFDKELVCTSDGLSVRCVPYNEETKHLVGTTDDCPEYYKWWEE